MKPVSYTHLDVYKRQGLSCGRTLRIGQSQRSASAPPVDKKNTKRFNKKELTD